MLFLLSLKIVAYPVRHSIWVAQIFTEFREGLSGIFLSTQYKKVVGSKHDNFIGL